MRKLRWLEVDHHLEEGRAAHVALRLDRVHQHLEGCVLVVVRAQGRLSHPGQQLPKRGIAREIGAQHQGVEQEADESLGFDAGAVGDGRAQGDVILHGVAVQQGREGRGEHHEGRRSLLLGQLVEPLIHLAGQLEPEIGAVGGLHGRAGTVGGQLQRLQARQLLLPPADLLGHLLGADAFQLPGREIRILDEQRRQVGLLTRGQSLVDGRQLLDEHGHGPAIGDDVVHGEEEDVVIFAQAQGLSPQQGPAGQVEGLAGVGDGQLADARLPLVLGRVAEVTHGQVHGHVVVDALHGLASHLMESGAQNLVTFDDVIQAAGQQGDGYLALDADGGEIVVEGRARFELVQEPEALLPRRQGQVPLPGDGLNLGLESGIVPGLALFLQDELGQSRHGRALEQPPQGQADVIAIPQAGDDLRGQQGMPAQLEEVIVDADRPDAQGLFPQGDDVLFQIGFGRDEGRGQVGPGMEPRADRGGLFLARRGRLFLLGGIEPGQPGVQICGGDRHLGQIVVGQKLFQRLQALFGQDGQVGRAQGRVVHPAIFEGPAIPIDAHPGDARAAGLLGCERVHEGVGGRVRGHPIAAQNGGERGLKQHEIELAACQRPGQGHGSQHFGPIVQMANVLGELGQGRQRVQPHDARGVEDAVQVAEAFHRLLDDRAHGVLVGHVRGQDQDLRAQGLQLAHRPDLAGDGVVGQCPVQGRVPLLPRGQGRAPHQGQPRAHFLGQIAGEEQAHVAQAAGDEIDAAGAQTGITVDWRGQGIERLHPAPSSPIRGHDVIGQKDVAGHLAGQPQAGAFLLGHGDVEEAATDVGELLPHDLAWAQGHGLERMHLRHAREVQGLMADEDQPQGLGDVAFVERPHQEHEGGDPAAAGAFEIVFGHVPGDDDGLGQQAVIVEIGDEGQDVAAMPRPQGEAPRCFHAEALARTALQHLIPRFLQDLGQRPAQFIPQDEPGCVVAVGRGQIANDGRAPPGRHIEPLADVLALGQSAILQARRGQLQPGHIGLDPVTLPLEGVGGQGDAVAPLVLVERVPVQADARGPELAQGLQQEGLVVARHAGMA